MKFISTNDPFSDDRYNNRLNNKYLIFQVERKKVSEIERSYVLEKSKTEMLGKKVLELVGEIFFKLLVTLLRFIQEEQLYSTNVENDAINDRFELMIHDREKQIKALRVSANPFIYDFF